MMTLILNHDTEHPVNVNNISYNVAYQNSSRSHTENLNGTTVIDAIPNLNFFEGKEITSVAIDGKEWTILNSLILDNLNMYQDGNSSGAVSFNMSYYAPIEE